MDIWLPFKAICFSGSQMQLIKRRPLLWQCHNSQHYLFCSLLVKIKLQQPAKGIKYEQFEDDKITGCLNAKKSYNLVSHWLEMVMNWKKNEHVQYILNLYFLITWYIKGFFTRNRLWHFCYIDLKLNGFDIIQTKKAEKSSCFLQFTQCLFNLKNYIDSLVITIALFSKSFFYVFTATSQPRIKRPSQSIGTKVSLIIFFFLSATNQHFVFFFFHLWQWYSFSVADFCYNVHWEDDINPFTRKNETKCVKIIPRFSVYVPIHN